MAPRPIGERTVFAAVSPVPPLSLMAPRPIGAPDPVTNMHNWTGMQTIPNLISLAPADDVTTRVLAIPVPELAALRKTPALVSMPGQQVGAVGGLVLPTVQTRHYDATVTFRGLASLSFAEMETLAPGR